MKFNFASHQPSKTLCVAALVLWICSLAMTGIVLYSRVQRIPGFEIVAMGWLSPLVGNFAWYANLFFLYGFTRLIVGKSAVKSSIFAVLLSLDTFRFNQYLLDEGGATTPVYGYGWGAVLWFLAISLLLSAAGTQQLETQISADIKKKSGEGALRYIGFVLCAIVLLLTAYWSLHDRNAANIAERRQLVGLAFKRGAVCGSPEPTVAVPVREFYGTLEVVLGKGSGHAAYPFGQVKELLDWGVPVVRIGDTDYSFDATPEGVLLSSVPSSDKPSAILYVEENAYSGDIRAKLIEVSSNRIVFDQIWNRQKLPVNFDIFCPDYQSFPKENEYPRKLLVEALNLPQKPIAESDHTRDPFDNKVKGTVIKLTEGINQQGSITPQHKLTKHKRHIRQPNQLPAATALIKPIFNINCGEDIGWEPESNGLTHIGWPFYIGDKAYYPGPRDKYKAICTENYAYLYYSFFSNGNYSFVMDKRKLTNFNQEWTGVVIIQGSSLTSNGRDEVTIQAINETDGELALTIKKEGSGQAALVKATLDVHK